MCLKAGHQAMRLRWSEVGGAFWAHVWTTARMASRCAPPSMGPTLTRGGPGPIVC